MPQNFIYETAITVDHELNELRLDTTVKAVATQALRCGLKDVTTKNSQPYRRFLGHSDQFRLRKPKGVRSVRGAAQKTTLPVPRASEDVA
jgi:hypothetical protein